jgi:hypothetical protein
MLRGARKGKTRESEKYIYSGPYVFRNQHVLLHYKYHTSSKQWRSMSTALADSSYAYAIHINQFRWSSQADRQRTQNVNIVARSRNQQCAPTALLRHLMLSRMLLRRFNVTCNNTTHTQNARCLCPILTKFGFSRQIFIRVSNIKFHENPPSGSRADICGRTAGHEECNRHFARVSGRA